MQIQLLTSLNGFIGFMPTRATDGAAGYDVFMPERGVITPTEPGQEPQKLMFGFATALPEGYCAKVRVRSSVGKAGIELCNAIGLIDADFRGEWKAYVYNKSVSPYYYNMGDRLFQFTIEKVEFPVLEKVFELPQTYRGNMGFGTTGI